jgi:hypothetical protein
MKLLFFTPFCGVLQHARSEIQLAIGLRKAGHEVFFIHCDGLYRQFCIAMSAAGLKEDSGIDRKMERCAACKRVRDLHVRANRFPHDLLRDDEADLREADRLLAGVDAEHWVDFTHGGLPIGRIASYEFLINYKKNSLTLSEMEWAAYRIALRNTLLTYFHMKRRLSADRPDRVLIYDTGYSVNGIVGALAASMGIPVFDNWAGANLSDRLSNFIVTRSNSTAHYRHLKTIVWDRFKGVPITREQVRYVGDHFRALFRATNVFAYSSPRNRGHFDLRSRFGVAPGQKVLAATLSSYDERFAGNVLGRSARESDALFRSQTEWCAALIDWIARKPELFLVIRVHPREFPNKRESLKSVHVQKLEALFVSLPQNVAINWPTDQISIYNLAEGVDVFLNAWSSTGVEMGLLGLPVVIYSNELPYYPAELNRLGKTTGDYFAAIEAALGDGWQFEKMRMAFRWFAMFFTLPCIRLREPRRTLNAAVRRLLDAAHRRIPFAPFADFSNRLYLGGAFFPDGAVRLVEGLLERGDQSLADGPHPEYDPHRSVHAERAGIDEEIRSLMGPRSRFPALVTGHLGHILEAARNPR